jgi:hypothetical protein
LRRPKYLRCKANQHAFPEDGSIPLSYRRGLGLRMDLKCMYCPTIRIDVISRATGDVVTRRYWRPDDYKDTHPYTKSDYRRMWVADLCKEH